MILKAVITALTINSMVLIVPPLQCDIEPFQWVLTPVGTVLAHYPGTPEIWGVYQVRDHGLCQKISLTNPKKLVILKLESVNYCYEVFRKPIGYILNKDTEKAKYISLY